MAATSAGLLVIVLGLAGVLSCAPAMAAIVHPVALVASQVTYNVTPFNATTNVPGAAIPFGTTSSGIAVYGQTGYITSTSSGTVTPINVANEALGTPISVGASAGPYGIAITPNGQYLYVTDEGTNTVSVISTATNTVTTTIPVGTDPLAIAIAPNGTAYVTNEMSNNVSVINTVSNTVTTTIPIASGTQHPVGVAISPDGSTAYVANEYSNTVSVISTSSNTVTSTWSISGGPAGVVVARNGLTLYVTNIFAGTVSPVSTSTGSVGTTIPTGASPRSITLSPSGSTAYVANVAGSTVTPINTTTNTAGTGIDVADGPVAIAIANVSLPSNTTAPAITGTTTAGQTLTASGGTWNNSPFTPYAYQWQDCDSSGLNCTNITGATSSTYTLTSGDVGDTLVVVETATNTAGPASSPSVATAVVTPPAPTSTTAPAISGTARAGQTLTASTGTWTSTPTGYAYQWQDCDSSGSGCTDIAGATSSSYTLTAADAGHTVRVVVTASNGGGSAQADSAATTLVPSGSAPPTTTTGTTSTPGTTTGPTSPGDGVTLSTQAAAAGVDVSGTGALQLPLVCPQTATGCGADGNLALTVSGASSHAVSADAQAPVKSSIIAQFAGVQIETGHSRLVSVKLTPAATRNLQIRGVRRVRVTLTIHNHLSGGPGTTTTQRLWLNIAALRASCPAAVGTLTGSSIGQMRLGLTPGQAHRLGRHRKAGYGFERYCLTAGAIRVRYPTHALLASLSATQRHQQAGRVYLALTANTHYTINGVHARTTVAAAKKRLALGTGITIGKNTWYLVSTAKAVWVLKAQKGVIHEIGITSRSLASTPQARRLLAHNL